MAAQFKYIAMTITGAMHLALGILCFIISIVGFSVRSYGRYRRYSDNYDTYYYYEYPTKGTAAGSFIVSLWIIAVGIVGIITGKRSNSSSKTQKMRIVYLVFTILSAAVFSIGGITSFVIHGIWAAGTYIFILFFFGVFLMFLEFVLAIVTSSICCCCSGIEEYTAAAQRLEMYQATNTNAPPVFVCTTDVAAPHMPPQYNYPPFVDGAQMPPPQYNATAPNVAENAMPISKAQ